MENFVKYNNTDLNEVYSDFLNQYYEDSLLVNHRTYIENNKLGFGEKPFHIIWRELVKNQLDNFKFLEIGVYKGQVLSLVKLLSDTYKKNVELYGVTPLDSLGDKFSSYDKTNYQSVIENLFKTFNLEFSTDKNIIIGDSTTQPVKDKIKDLGIFDLIYIDGCHNYDCVVSDINLMKEISKKDTIVVFDDSSCYKNLSNDKFKGHIDVCNAIKDLLENDPNFVEILCVGHNRVFKKIN